MDNITNIRISEVLSVYDENDGQRIKARVLPEDQDKNFNEIPYAFPLLPKMLHVMPKVGEAVLIFCSDPSNGRSQRYYLGPIIHQPQFMNFDSSVLGATTLLNGGVGSPSQSISTIPEAKGALPNDEDVAIVGRGISDAIFSDNEVILRSGVKIRDENDNSRIVFNKKNPSYIKISQHDTELEDKSKSTVSIVSENINLLSTASKKTGFDLTDMESLITQDEMNNILKEAHVLPYGDILVNFLKLFLKAFNTHTHPYSGLPPVQDDTYIKVNEYDMNDMLSDNIRIN